MQRKLTQQHLEKLSQAIKKTRNLKQASSPNITSSQVEDIVAFRRGKVRELKRLGYDTHAISDVLSKGIKGKDGELIHVECGYETIKRDIRYLEQEDIGSDPGIALRRADLVDKLNFIYNRAMHEFVTAEDQNKNPFLGTALAALKELRDIYGITAPTGTDSIPIKQAEKFKDEIDNLSKEERDALVSAISKIS